MRSNDSLAFWVPSHDGTSLRSARCTHGHLCRFFIGWAQTRKLRLRNDVREWKGSVAWNCRLVDWVRTIFAFPFEHYWGVVRSFKTPVRLHLVVTGGIPTRYTSLTWEMPRPKGKGVLGSAIGTLVISEICWG